jgi:hypothetical protein
MQPAFGKENRWNGKVFGGIYLMGKKLACEKKSGRLERRMEYSA